MIAHLSGTIIKKSTEAVVIDVGGVGYELAIPLSTYAALPELRDTVSLHVHTTVRDDSIKLYGFLTSGEKDLFRLFITVSGIGPKLARNILSGLSVDDLLRAISTEDKAKLSTIPGVGRKATERIIIDLKEKVAALGVPRAEGPATGSVLADEVTSALLNLGYKAVPASDAVDGVIKRLGGAEVAFEKLLKEALREISKR
ncbi:MAG: Holliday junction branch migration protein RuvA [Thermodesulfobacteriota bacterium]